MANNDVQTGKELSPSTAEETKPKITGNPMKAVNSPKMPTKLEFAQLQGDDIATEKPSE